MYVGPAGVLFVEYKYLKNFPKRPNTPVKINVSPLQIAWMEEMAKSNSSNVTCLVCIGCANNAFIVSIDALSSAISSKEAQSISVPFSEIASKIKESTGYVEEDRSRKPAETLAKKERHL
jgi:penicillin-binding protein-related factor A (putative recombinase)